MFAKYIILLSISSICLCQRPFYAGKKPIGYPEIISTYLPADATMFRKYLLLLAIASPCFSQRPFYAGKRPIGYPVVVSTRRSVQIPPELNGDVSYASKLDALPVDQQPFWYLNREHYNEFRKNPKSWPQKPRGFNDNGIES